MNHLFLTPGRRDEWLDLIQSEDPTALAILEQLREDSEEDANREAGDPNATPRKRAHLSVQRNACLAWLHGEKPLADSARKELLSLLNEASSEDLGKAADTLAAVLLWDFCADLWEPTDREAFARRISELARSFLQVSGGNPHIVTNNWWMITHGACLLACIAVDGEEGLDGPVDLSDLKAWSLERFKAFCGVFGNAGLYHEGSGYIAYTLSMLLPAIVAVQRHLEPDILEKFPQFHQSIPSMLIGTATFAHKNNGYGSERWGAALQWNDAGRDCLGPNPFIPGIELAPESLKGALRYAFDKLSGIHEGNDLTLHYSGLPLLVALYPFSTTSTNPEDILPKHVLDQRQGLGMWRSSWGDGSEPVFGWYARSTHPGGHAQDDAASIRLMALRRTWICGGGQARAKAEWQSVFTHANMEDRPMPSPLAYLTCNHVHDTGGVVSLDTRKSLGAYSERYLSWRTDLGFPFVLAMMDLLNEHRDPPLDWQWNLSFPRDLDHEVHADGSGFSLIDKVLGRLDGRFLIDMPDSLSIEEMPGSSRTYSSGPKVDYPGDRFIHASFRGVKNARILVGITITPAGPSRSEIAYRENAIMLNDTKWEHPFSPAILKSVDLAQSAPNRMTFPAG